MRQKAAEATQATVADLARRGYVHRDIGYLLGMSHQAVGKLLNEAEKEAAASADDAGTRSAALPRKEMLDQLCMTRETEALFKSYLLEVAASDPADRKLNSLRALGEQLRHGRRRRLTDA
ncbi:hypothetical protein [Nonomuraea fuscirosea]|uniref:hypothetical protein n=1 Tax=Nonomuraea fuscirosea TaxID=1291556 RepID=UPI0034198CE8